MYQMTITLSNVDYKEDLFLALQSIGVTRASAIEAKNLSNSLESEYSIFQGFLGSQGSREGEQLIILCTIDSLDQARELVDNLTASGMGLALGKILRMNVVPVSLAFDGEFRT